MAKVKAQSQIKKKKKIWIQINAPKLFGNKKIGETNVYEAQSAVGKTVEQNLMTLTGEMKKQNITVKFMIDRVNGTVASTKVISYKMAPSFIKRMVRRRRDKIEFSKVFVTKDKVKVRIKPLIITTSRTRGSTATAIMKKAQALIAKNISALTFDSLVEQIISYKFQLGLKSALKSTHPLKNCDIRTFNIEKEKKRKDDVDIEDATQEPEEKAQEEEKEEKEEIKKEKTEEKKETAKSPEKEEDKKEEEIKKEKEEVKEKKTEEKKEAETTKTPENKKED